MNLEEKKQYVKKLKETITKAKSVVFVNYSGIETQTMEELRQKITATEGSFQVAKNTLVKRALDNRKEFSGPTAIVCAYENPIEPIKFLTQVEKDGTWIKGGIFENKLISKEEVLELSKIPGKESLFSQLVNTLSTPITSATYLLEEPLRQFTMTLPQISKQ